MFNYDSPRAEIHLDNLNVPDEQSIRFRIIKNGLVCKHGEVIGLKNLPNEMLMLPLVVWIPAESTFTLLEKVPTNSKNKLKKAIPFILENATLEDIDNIEYVYFKHDNNLVITGMSKNKLQSLLTELRKYISKKITIVPDYYFIPVKDDSWSFFFCDERLIIRCNEKFGFSCLSIHQEIPQIIKLALQEAEKNKLGPTKLEFWSAPNNIDTKLWENELDFEVINMQKNIWSDIVLEPEINLLHDNEPMLKRHVKKYMPLLPAACAASILFIFIFVTNIVQWWQLTSEHNYLVTAKNELFKKTFPKTPMLDPVKQFEKHVAQNNQKKNDMLFLLNNIAPLLIENKQFTVNKINYKRNNLIVDLDTASYRMLDTLKITLANKKMNYELISTKKVEDIINARIKVWGREMNNKILNNKILQKCYSRWNELHSNEKYIYIFISILIFILMFYLILISPMQTKINSLQKSVPAHKQDYIDMKKMSSKIGVINNNYTTENILILVEKSLLNNNLNKYMENVKSIGSDSVNLNINNVEFNKITKWISQLDSNINIKEADIVKTNVSGVVNAIFILEKNN